MVARLMLICFCLLLLIGTAVQAQPAPTIERFTVDNNALSYPAVEGGTAAANFSWRAVGLRDGDQMRMEALVGGQWVLIGEGFEPEKIDRLVIAHPLNYIMPRYRLSVVDASGAMVSEQTLDLNYAPPEGLPTISMFLAFPPTGLIGMSAFVEPFRVQWQVNNRWFNSNIALEQVMPDGSVVNVEQPQPSAWQYAHATGYVQLRYPGDYQDVVLQLRVYNRDDNGTLAQGRLVLHVENTQAPTSRLVNFTVTPERIDPQGTLTLTWEAANTDAVFIEYEDGNPNGSCAGNLETVYELPPSGTLDVTAPEYAYGALRFRLFADYHLPGARHHCGSFETPLRELTVELTDYIGQGVEYFRAEPLRSVVGDSVTLSWSVTEGESVTITYPRNGSASLTQGGPDVIPVYTRFDDLPLAGSLALTIPDDPLIRDSAYSYGYVWLYVVETGALPRIPDSSATLIYDRDGDLNCDPVLNVGEAAFADSDVSVTWDSCGNPDTLLRLALVTGGYGADPVSEEFVAVEPAGTTIIHTPDEEGTFYIQLYYAHQGGRYLLVSSPLELEKAAG